MSSAACECAAGWWRCVGDTTLPGPVKNESDSVSLPKITVLMAVYNAAKYLRVAVQSILDQSLGDFEFLIVNDGSTDSSRDILLSFNDPRLRLLENPRNLGLTKSLNRGLEAARGQYIARMDADDISLPERFAKQLTFLEAHPEIGVLGTGFTWIDEQGKPGKTILYSRNHGFILWYLCFQNSIVHPSVMLRRDLILKFGGYREEALDSEDYDLWLRMGQTVRFANLEEPLILLRQHPESITSLNLVRQNQISWKIRLEQVPQLVGNIDGVQFKTVEGKLPAREWAQYILGVYRNYSGMKGLTDDERQAIRRDAADRLLIAAISHWSGSGAASVLVSAIQMDPAVLGRLLALPFKLWLSQRLMNPIIK